MTVSAGGDATVAALSGLNLSPVSAGGDATLFGSGGLNSMASAGGDLVASSLGTIQGNYSAGGSATISAVGSLVSISATAGTGDLTAITWSTISGVSTFSGGTSAVVWAASDISGANVSASNGDAVLVSFGNAVIIGVSGSGDAVAFTVGNLTGPVSGGGFAGAIALGDFNGSVSGGDDAAALTYGYFNGTLSAGQDAELFSVGNATGTVTAGRDAAVAAYGALSTTVSAGRDISDIWSGGSIAGSFSAMNNISGGVYSYGSISASFTAMGTLGDPTTGVIGLTHAAGGIAGSFSGTNQVMDMIAGGSITAIVTSASIGGLFAFDSTMGSAATPMAPTNPASDILAALATAQSALNAQVSSYNGSTSAAYLQASSDLATQTSNATTGYATALANAQSDLTTSNNNIRTDANNDYNTAQAAAIAGINAAVLAAANEWAAIQTQVAQQLATASAQNAAESLAAGNTITTLGAGIAQASAALNTERASVGSRQFQEFTTANAEIAAYPDVTWQAMKTWAIDLAQAFAANVAEYLNYIPVCGAQQAAGLSLWSTSASTCCKANTTKPSPHWRWRSSSEPSSAVTSASHRRHRCTWSRSRRLTGNRTPSSFARRSTIMTPNTSHSASSSLPLARSGFANAKNARSVWLTFASKTLSSMAPASTISAEI